MWIELYNKVKTWMLEKKPEQWIISKVQNSREMENSYVDLRSLTHLLNFLEKKASEELAIQEGTIDYEGELFVSIGGTGWDG